MNYRHAYHAGNFADVLKHAVLALVLQHLARKDQAFRVIDTHAGIGLYDLASTEADKTQEWRAGIGRLTAATLAPAARAVLAPYLDTLDAIRALNGPLAYPGSPEIARHLTRAQDRMIFIEKHPQDAARLEASVAGDRRAKVIRIDGWTGLKAYVPPVERRGLVLVDPPFEEPGEFARMQAMLSTAWAKWATGTYLLWYPIKDPAEVAAFHRAVQASGVRKVLCIEQMVTSGRDPSRLNGSGLLVVNPPWTLEEECRVLLPALGMILRQEVDAASRCFWLVSER